MQAAHRPAQAWSAAVARGQPRPDGGQRPPSGGRPPVILAGGGEIWNLGFFLCGPLRFFRVPPEKLIMINLYPNGNGA